MKIWTLYLVLPGRYGPLLSGISTFVLLVLIQLWLVGEIFWVSTGLFFAAMLAYLPAVHAYILGITRTAVAELAPNLSVSTEQQSATLERMARPGWRLQVICLVAGSSAAIAHIQYMGFIPLNLDGTLDFFNHHGQSQRRRYAADLDNHDYGDQWAYTEQLSVKRLVYSSQTGRSVSQATLAAFGASGDSLVSGIDWQQCAVSLVVYRIRLAASDENTARHDADPAYSHRDGNGTTALRTTPYCRTKNQRLKAIDEAIGKLTNPQSITDMQTLNTLLTQRGHLQNLQLAVEPGQPRTPVVLSDHSTSDP